MATAELSGLRIHNRTDQTRAFGLVTIVGSLTDVDGEPAQVTISAAGTERSFFASDVLKTTKYGFQLEFNLITQLIGNGLVDIGVEILFVDGISIPFSNAHFKIENDNFLAQEVAADLKTMGQHPIQPRVIDSGMFPYQNGKAKAWFDEIVPIDIAMSFDQAPDIQSAHRHLERWGFCILPNLLPESLIEGFKTELDTAIDAGQLPYVRGTSERIHNAHRLPSGRKIWLLPEVLEFLQLHFRNEPCACQTLTYVHGSEQGGHQDTIHLTPYPAGYMCGVWIALEDVLPDSGELFVYPGSHKTPRVRARDLGLEKVDEDYSSYEKFSAEIERLVKEGGYERNEYRPKAGQILVWHENLVHGGSPRRDRSVTRLSIVSHYFAKGSIAYYDSRGEAASLELVEPELA